MLPSHITPEGVRRGLAALLAAVALGCTAPSPVAPGTPTPEPSAATSTAATSTATTSPTRAADVVTWHRAMAYGPDPAQVLDVAVPGAAVPSPTGDRDRRPAMVLVHGGGWTTGDRHHHADTAAGLAALGWVGVTIDYRLAPAATHPAAEQDVRSALAHVHDHAADLGIDPDRVVLAGDSAGGHLAALVALQDDRPPVAAWVSWSGVHALEQLPARLAGTQRAWLVDHVAAYLGCDPAAAACAATARDASPVTHASADDPPGLLAHSTDELVPLDDARQLRDALDEVGAPVDLVTREGQAHGGDLIEPTSAETAAFLEAVLDLRAAG